MKKVLALGASCVGSLLLSGSTSASLLIYEPFDYTAGAAITGQANTYSAAPETWQLAGTTAALHVVGSGSLTPPGPLAPGIGNSADLKKSGTSSAYDRLSIPNAFVGVTPVYGPSSTLYYSALLNVPSLTGLTIANTNLNANNDGLIAFNNNQGASATAPNTWNGELVIRLGAAAGTYNLGIRGSTSTANTTYFTPDLTPGQTYFVVVQASLGATPTDPTQNLNSLWVNPNPSTFGLDEGSRPAPDGSTNGANSSTNGALDVMESLIIGAGIATSGAAPNDTSMDEIRVGNTWADVTTVPEPASLALMGLGLTALAATRRRRCAK